MLRAGDEVFRTRRRRITTLVVALCCAPSCTPFKDTQQADGDAGEHSVGSVPDGGCGEDSDCPASTPCADVRCEKGACVIRSSKDGAPVAAAMQVAGDCRQLVCDGRGQIRVENDDADLQADANPCHEVSCVNGTREVMTAPDATPCNGTGVCQEGSCSVCSENDCSRPSDCTVYRGTCREGKYACENTGIPRAGRACETGKVCHEGSCVPCVIGAECDTGAPCYLGRITSCADGLTCEPHPQSGMACGSDAMGRAMYCVAGLCTTPCGAGPCMTASDPCQTSHANCSTRGDEPKCVPVAREDGWPCGDASACRAGTCVTHALVNGDFTRGLEGWEVSGDGAKFLVSKDSENYDRLTLSTAPEAAGGGAARGSVWQTFTVPSDAQALRFNVSGGSAHVRLKDPSGAVIEEVTGTNSTDVPVPVSWLLTSRRGQRLTLAIDDDLASGDWAYIRVTGFDVLRSVAGPIRNPSWEEGFASWETTGDASYFNIYNDYDYARDAAYGRRLSVSTYAYNRAATSLGASTRGTLSQTFVVPNDAVALRFNVCGGADAEIRLLDGAKVLYTAKAIDSDETKIPISWALEPFRGKMLRLLILDESAARNGYIGITGIDVITSHNGP